MTIIPVPERINSKQVNGTFYPLQKDELIALRQSRLINNAAYVHLALRFSNPFCDRPIELIPKEFALAWSIPESSVYEALGKLKQKKIVDIKTGKVVISWTNQEEGRGQEAGGRRKDLMETETSTKVQHHLDDDVLSPVERDKTEAINVDSHQQTKLLPSASCLLPSPKEDSGSLEDLRDIREDSEISENNLETQNELLDSRINSESSEKQSLEVLPDIDSDSPQTIQTHSNLQTNQTSEEEGEKKEEETVDRTNIDDERVTEKDEANTVMSALSDVLATPLENEEDKPSPKIEKVLKKINSANSSNIPQDLRNKLEELEIILDSKVLKAISSHHISQAYGAAAHVEKTWETIDNPKSIFLYQLPKQPVEQLGCRGDVKTARDFGGYTIEHMKKIYGKKWEEAAKHFGLEVE
jgi:hypothetical protein